MVMYVTIRHRSGLKALERLSQITPAPHFMVVDDADVFDPDDLGADPEHPAVPKGVAV